jgi:hypothetical protein
MVGSWPAVQASWQRGWKCSITVAPSSSASTSYSTSLGFTRTRQKSQGTPQPLPPHIRMETARRKAATFSRAGRGSPTDVFSSAGADPFIRIRLVPLVRKRYVTSRLCSDDVTGASVRTTVIHEEYLATTATSAMFPTVGLKSIKKPVFRGLKVARRPSRWTEAGDSPWWWIVVPSRAAGEAVDHPRPAGFSIIL